MSALLVEVCDHCDRVPRGVSLTPYRIGDGPVLHICGWCESKPFRRVVPSARLAAVQETVNLAMGAL